MSKKKRAAAAATAVVGVGGLLPASAGATTLYPQFHHNIQGHNDGHNGAAVQSSQVRLAAQAHILAGNKPSVISLNEVCLSQAIPVWNMLQEHVPNGYKKYWSVTRTSGLHSGCQGEYGNALYALGVEHARLPSNGQGYTYSGQSGLAEKRKLGCLQMGDSSPKYWACNTHFKNDLTIAGDQLEQVKSRFDAWGLWPKDPMLLGDLNIPYSLIQQPTVTSWNPYVHMQEFDECGGSHHSTTHGSGIFANKYDYIFADKPEWQCDGQGYEYSLQNSDHRLIRGNLEL